MGETAVAGEGDINPLELTDQISLNGLEIITDLANGDGDGEHQH